MTTEDTTAEVPDLSQVDLPPSTELLTSLEDVLVDLLAFVPLITKLVDSRPVNLRFVTAETLAVQSELARTERQLRREAEILGAPTGRGQSPTPGNLAALSVDVQVWAATVHQVRRLTRYIAKGTGTTHPAPAEGTTTTLIRHIANLVPHVDSGKVLRATLADLQHAHRLASDLVDGDTRARFPAPCPNCSHPTLVVNFKDDEIRCDRHPRTGRFMPCVCADPMCDCKTEPIAHRHTWSRTATGASSWYGLGDRINIARLARKDNE